MENRTYRYFQGTPLYPFGYGLSYTQFETVRADFQEGNVRMTILNKGNRDGETVAQVYVACDSPLAPKNPRLCGFIRVMLKAGEESEILVKLDPLTWTVVNEEGEREEVRKGTLYAGLNQPDELSEKLMGNKSIAIKVGY